jgi:2-keto-4-pentenoate hydratase
MTTTRPDKIEQAVDDFWRGWQDGVYFPDAWLNRLTIDEGFQVQLGLLRRQLEAGERQAGWKVGLTSPGIQQQFGVNEPLFGYLLESARLENGVEVDFESLLSPAVEFEICVEIGAPLAGPGVDAAAAAKAVRRAWPAIEVVETRGDLRAYLSVAVVDNIQQKALVLGEDNSVAIDDATLAGIWATASINDEEVAHESATAVLGDPLNSLAWLANKLSEYGQALKPGDVVMTGSLTRQFAVSKGTKAAAVFDRLGRVEVTFP